MDTQLTTTEPRTIAVPPTGPSTGELLAAVVSQDITPASAEVIERLVALRDRERAHENKAAFNRALFALKREISGMEFYADKSAKTKNGATAFTYCSEAEISEKLEPVLFKHGFAMIFGQRQDGERITSEITLIHEDGHEEKREYTVTRGRSNDMKDATAVDTSATTSAWRHLVIKLFGLKSRIREEGDARNVGEHIPAEKAAELRRRCAACGMREASFLRYAHASTSEDPERDGLSFEQIGTVHLAGAELLLRGQEAKAAKAAKPDTSLAKEELLK